MNDINTRLCKLLDCDVPRPKDICPTCGKTNTDGKMRFIDGADFFSETGRIDLKEHRISDKVLCFFGDILMSQAKKLNPNAIEIILDIDVRMMICEQVQIDSPQAQEGT